MVMTIGAKNAEGGKWNIKKYASNVAEIGQSGNNFKLIAQHE